jgi:hypothetical protein
MLILMGVALWVLQLVFSAEIVDVIAEIVQLRRNPLEVCVLTFNIQKSHLNYHTRFR